MASSPRSEREEERRLNVQTLAIASVASASAAAITSQLWIAGTWIAAAVTPVLVALLSEAIHRPTEKIARSWTSDRPALGETAVREPIRVPDAESPPDRRGPPGEPAPGEPAPGGPPPGRRTVDGPRDPGAPRPGEPGPVRVYRGSGRRPSRRRIAFGVVAATAAIAFVIGVVLFTTTELIAGQPIGKGGGRTTIGIGGSGKKDTERDEQQQPSPSETEERPERQERPSTEQEDQPTTTETTPAPTVPEETTTQPTPAPQEAPAPSETAPAP